MKNDTDTNTTTDATVTAKMVPMTGDATDADDLSHDHEVLGVVMTLGMTDHTSGGGGIILQSGTPATTEDDGTIHGTNETERGDAVMRGVPDIEIKVKTIVAVAGRTKIVVVIMMVLTRMLDIALVADRHQYPPHETTIDDMTVTAGIRGGTVAATGGIAMAMVMAEEDTTAGNHLKTKLPRMETTRSRNVLGSWLPCNLPPLSLMTIEASA